MGQLTLARFRGDTVFALVARVFSTTLGSVLGLVLWYISAGSGKGNAYGLAVVIGVSSPFLVFWRLYWPIHPITNIVYIRLRGPIASASKLKRQDLVVDRKEYKPGQQHT